MSVQKLTVAALMAALTLGCSSPGSIPVVQSEYWKGHEFGAFERYAWLASDVENAEQAQSVAPRTHGLIQRMIDQRVPTENIELDFRGSTGAARLRANARQWGGSGLQCSLRQTAVIL
jgi:hypothetical protein